MRTIYFDDEDIKKCKFALVKQELTSIQSAFLVQYILNLEQKNQKQKEVIDKAINMRDDFVAKNPLIIFENDGLLQFMNNLLDVLKEVE